MLLLRWDEEARPDSDGGLGHREPRSPWLRGVPVAAMLTLVGTSTGGLLGAALLVLVLLVLVRRLTAAFPVVGRRAEWRR